MKTKRLHHPKRRNQQAEAECEHTRRHDQHEKGPERCLPNPGRKGCSCLALRDEKIHPTNYQADEEQEEEKLHEWRLSPSRSDMKYAAERIAAAPVHSGG